MSLRDLYKTTCEWMRVKGAEGDVALSSRVRLARNVAEQPFVSRCSTDESRRLERTLAREVKDAPIWSEMLYLRLTKLEPVDRLLLVERHLISREHAEAAWERGVAFDLDEVLSVMINEEDHLRIQVILPGYDLGGAWERADRVDDALGRRVQFAFSPKYGFLTACPTNVGTGLRVSVMLHLPALAMTRQMEKAFAAVGHLQLAVRGLYGEGTGASGDLFQVSNQVSLGVTEQDVIDRVDKVVPEIIRFEREARQGLLAEHKTRLQDRIFRALGLLRMARTISSEESLHFLSQIRMGIGLGIVEDVSLDTVNELFVLTLPAHLQRIEGRGLTSGERNEARARFIRKRLGGA
jgi:protein arginine kinase